MSEKKKPSKRRAKAIEKEEPEEPKANVTEESKEPKLDKLEAKIIRRLSCTDESKRNLQVCKLAKWFKMKTSVTKEDFVRIWRALCTTVSMCENPIGQQELAQRLAKMVDNFGGKTSYSLAFFSAFMSTMAEDIFGPEQWLMDKFLILVRQMLHHILLLLKHNNWSVKLIKTFNKGIQKSVFSKQIKSRGLSMHYLNIFFIELGKVADGEITAEQVNIFLRPFISYLVKQSDLQLMAQSRSKVLHYLLYQSELGREYSVKYNAWKSFNYPMTPPTISRDPKAGIVDVLIPVLPIDPDFIINELKTLINTNNLTRSRYRSLGK
ncbi:hypothetical protein KR200_009935, partial [Drosophila serrata]